MKFRELSDKGKLVFIFMLTHPYMTSLGAMRASVPGLAAELRWSEKAFKDAFQESVDQGMVKFDIEASFVWLPNFIKYNRPESPNVVKAWSSALDLLPECELYYLLLQNVKAFTEGLPEAFREAFGEAFSKELTKAMPNQEQEQEQDKDNNANNVFPAKDSFDNDTLGSADESEFLKQNGSEK